MTRAPSSFTSSELSEATTATARCSRSQSVEFCLVMTAQWSGFLAAKAGPVGLPEPPVLQARDRSGRDLRARSLNRHGQPLRQGFPERPALHIQRTDNRWLTVCLFLKPDGVLRLPLPDKYQRLSLH